MGSGKWYGVAITGYVMAYYNEDLFAKNGLAIPKTFAELENVLANSRAQESPR